MKYVDIIVQTLIFVLTIAFATAEGWQDYPPAYLLIGQLFMGIWQLLSAVISILATRVLKQSKVMCLLLALIYLCFLLLMGKSPLETDVYMLFFTIPAWMLAIAYYIITWKWVLIKRKRGSFLPNLSF